jgi:hypothetical protein
VVWFHRLRAVLWAIVGVLAFPLHLAESVALVWFASAYANAMTDWGAGEAADDRRVLEEIAGLRAELRDLRALIERGLPRDTTE